MSSKKCVICDADGTIPCKNCFTVFYCDKQHQKKDWNKHKSNCKPYRIQVSDKMGRFIISSRDIKPGEIILKEHPTVIGPTVDSHLICLGCHRILSKKNLTFCSKCGVAPVCSKECEVGTPHSGIECSYYQKYFKNKITGEFLSSNLQLVTPLRCLLLKEVKNNFWINFLELESHFEEKINNPIWQLYQEKIVNVLKSKNILTEDETIIQKICAILDINSFELRGPAVPPTGQNERLRGIYLEAALMSHDCTSNTHLSVDDNFIMTIRASLPIREGEPIHYNYSSSLETTSQRLRRLKEGKHFICSCKRCSDPTEFKTYMGSIICSRCYDGIVIPSDPYSEQKTWYCNKCNHEFNKRLIETTITEGWSLIEKTDATDFRKLEMLLKKLLKTFPEKGFLIIELKQKLIACLRDNILRQPNPSRNILKLKIKLCEELLEVLKIVEPGISRLKGINLYELHKPKMILANKEFRAKEITSHEFLSKLKECEKILKEAISFLIYEPHQSLEGRLNQIALNELKMLREEIVNVTTLCEDSER